MNRTCRSCRADCPGLVCARCGAFQEAALRGSELDIMIDLLEWQMHHNPWRADREYARQRKLELSILRCSLARQRKAPGAHRLVKDQ
jgi:hypothetical protein